MKNFLIEKKINKDLFRILDRINTKYQKIEFEKRKNKILENKEFLKFVSMCEKQLKNKKYKGIIISFSKNKKIKPELMVLITYCFSEALGELLPQNEKKDRVVFVFDRNREFSIHQGSRYHQTREGGSIHTDNVNINFNWDYMVLSCVSLPETGGENIFVNGDLVYKKLKKFKIALKELKKDFIWEKRGVSESFYKAPIIKLNRNIPEFRYLRPYLLSAYKRKNKKLNKKQLYALDTLDSILEASENQIRKKMYPGDLLLAKDSQLFHGRTSFSDFLNSKEISQKKKKTDNLKRIMLRAWIKKAS